MTSPSLDSTIKPLILYDLDSTLPINIKTWSPAVWRARYALNIKKIPYRTEWIELADVERTCKDLGADPTDKRVDGTPFYTVPFIIDPNTNRVVSDSLRIVEYLDIQYPETIPLLHVPGTRQSLTLLQGGFVDGFIQIIRPLSLINIPKEDEIVNPPSQDYLAAKMKRLYGFESLASMVPNKENGEWESAWAKVEENFSTIASWYHKYGNGESSKWMFGDGPTFADLGIAGILIWTKILFGEESEEWKKVSSWDGGRWARLLEDLNEYTTVV